MSNIVFSALESTRFNKKIFRGVIDTIDISQLSYCIHQNDPDIIIFRVPVSEQPFLHKLAALDRQTIIADTLVYYEVNLNKTTFNPIRNKDIVFKQATPADSGVFNQMIPVIFNNYTNHYYSNPLLDRAKITEGYIEWAINYISSEGKVNFIISESGIPCGFITCSYNNDEAEIILNGVLPQYSGKGYYTDMVRYVKQYFHTLNIPSLKVSTQIQNFTVQNVWSKEGLLLNKAYITIHLNRNNNQ